MEPQRRSEPSEENQSLALRVRDDSDAESTGLKARYNNLRNNTGIVQEQLIMQRIAFLLPWVLLGIAGCESGASTGPLSIEFTPAPAPSGQGFVALYSPSVDVGPYPDNIYNPVAAGAGLTLSVPEKITSPLATSLNTLDGFSTTATITAPFNAPLDPATLIPFNITAPTGTETIFVLDATNGVPLVPGLHYGVQVSTSAGADGTVLEFLPLVPLAPATTYVFILTSGIQNAFGVAAGART